MATDVLTKPAIADKAVDEPADMPRLLGIDRLAGGVAETASCSVGSAAGRGAEAAAFRLKVLQKRQNMDCDALSLAKDSPETMRRLFR